MIFNYVKPLDLATDIEFGAKRIYMRYGEVTGVIITSNPTISSGLVNLIIKPYHSGVYNTSTKNYSLSLANFQQITFRTYFPELYLYQEIHGTGTETNFLALSQPAIDALTTEVNNIKDFELFWIKPLAPSYWNNTDTTLSQLLNTQFNMIAPPTPASVLGTVASGVITSQIDVDTLSKITFTTDTAISKGVYYIGVNVVPSGMVKYKLNGAGSYSNATYIGKVNNQYIYTFYSFQDYTLELKITNASAFNIKIYSRNPIVDYAI